MAHHKTMTGLSCGAFPRGRSGLLGVTALWGMATAGAVCMPHAAWAQAQPAPPGAQAPATTPDAQEEEAIERAAHPTPQDEEAAHPYAVSDVDDPADGPMAAPPTDLVPSDPSETQAVDASVQRLEHATAVFDLLLDEGSYWLAHHDLRRAHEAAGRALQIDPASPAALYLMARIEISQGGLPQAQALTDRLEQSGRMTDEVAQLRRMIKAGPPDPKLLAEARALAASGKMMPAMFKYKALFKNGDPPPDMALEYYRVLGATILGYQEARTKLAAYVAHNPHDLDAALTYYRVLTYRVTSRTEGMSGLERLINGHVPTGIHEEALRAWREALLWEPIVGQTVPLYKEWLSMHPDDEEVHTRLIKALETQATFDAANDRMEGYTLMAQRRFGDSEALFRKALAVDPKDVDALGGMGLVAQARGQREQARAYFEKALALDPDHADRWHKAITGLNGWKTSGGVRSDPLVAGIAHDIAVGDFAGAHVGLERLARRRNSALTVLSLQGALARREGNTAEAMLAYRTILERWPGNADALFNLADLLIASGHGEEARAMLPRFGTGHHTMVEYLEAELLAAEAAQAPNDATRIDLLRRAVATNPRSPWLRLRLAQTLYNTEDPASRAEAARIMADLTTSPHADVQALQAGVIYALSQHDTATAQRLLARIPDSQRTVDIDALSQQADLAQEIHDIEAAHHFDRKALMALADRSDPTGVRGVMIGNALIDHNMPQSVRDVLQAEERMTPAPQPQGMLSYAGLYLQVHDIADARRCLDVFDRLRQQDGVQVTAEQARLREQLGLAMQILAADQMDNRGHPARAKDVLAPLMTRYPDSVDLHLAMGRVYQARGDAQRALAEDRAALAIRPNNIYALASAARDAGGAGDMTAARAYARRLSDLQPDAPVTWEIRAEMARIDHSSRAQLADLDHVHEQQCDMPGTVHCGTRDSFLPDYRWPDIDSEYVNLRGATLPDTYHYLRQDDQIQATNRQMVYLRDSVSPQIDANTFVRSRTGTTGLGQLTEFAIPITGTIPFNSWDHRLSFSVTPTLLFTGDPLRNPSSARQFGTVAVNGAQPWGYHHYYTQGVGLNLSYFNRWFNADIGSSPLGMPIANVVGGVEFAPHLTRNLTLRISGGRRMVTDSELSYAGERDPGTGRKWGGVTRNFGHGALEWSEAGWNVYAGGGFAYLEGDNVVSNTETEAGAGGSATVWEEKGRQRLRVGGDLMYFGYKRDTYFFTWGQGGYFSPRDYFGAMVPVEWSGHTDHWTWFLRGEAGYQNYHSRSAPYYPTSSLLQSQLTAPSTFGGYGASGLAGNVRGRVVYQVNHRFRLGLEGGYTRAGTWSESDGMLLFHYAFDGQ
ncbi:Cellulose synthase operon protein C precursor [Novacetimonas maltaceti]|uniref:Cellulose synthase operon protein C n=2 Tax=Novacetimonas maltaceti TaxID=1203393 RepID=A0A2S3W0G9_9PROT|nr:Cellulose synthase operon protein C precursor [Novacetimonas maltaceti]